MQMLVTQLQGSCRLNTGHGANHLDKQLPLYQQWFPSLDTWNSTTAELNLEVYVNISGHDRFERGPCTCNPGCHLDQDIGSLLLNIEDNGNKIIFVSAAEKTGTAEPCLGDRGSAIMGPLIQLEKLLHYGDHLFLVRNRKFSKELSCWLTHAHLRIFFSLSSHRSYRGL